jgi:hypothetical protein
MSQFPRTARGGISQDSERDRTLAAIGADVESELAQVAASSDAPDDDEPGSEFLAARLRSLRDATSALQRSIRNL